MLIFHSLVNALQQGYHVFDRTATGYLVRTRTPRGWALALVELRDV